MGEYSVLELGIIPPFGWAYTVDLERNIPHIDLPIMQ